MAQRLFPRMLVSRQRRRLGTRPVQEQAGTLWQLLRRESSSAESSAANQRLLARTLAANQRLLLGGTLWLPPRRPLFSGAQSRQGAFPRLMVSRRQVVVVRRAPAGNLCPPSW